MSDSDKLQAWRDWARELLRRGFSSDEQARQLIDLRLRDAESSEAADNLMRAALTTEEYEDAFGKKAGR